MGAFRATTSFTKLNDTALIGFTGTVIQKMTGNESFATPVINMTSLGGARTTFANAAAAAAQGGTQLTAAKNAARAFLISCLRQLAAYVTSIACENLEMLLSSGFEAAKTSRTQIVLPTPSIRSVLPYQSGVLKVTAPLPPTARGFELRYKNGAGDYQSLGVFQSSRDMLIPGLVPGNTYTVQIRAVGGLTRYSDWSSPVSQMAM